MKIVISTGKFLTASSTRGPRSYFVRCQTIWPVVKPFSIVVRPFGYLLSDHLAHCQTIWLVARPFVLLTFVDGPFEKL